VCWSCLVKYNHQMCVMIFSKTFIWNIYHFKDSDRYCLKFRNVFM
jgi:hypothetical protein